MEDILLEVLEASIANPDDSDSVEVICAVASVGVNANGIEWTAEFLKEKAATFIGKPVNIFLDAEGEQTGHTRNAVGSITKSIFDEARQAIVVTATVWGHYFPRVAKRIKELYAAGKLKVSMEFRTNSASMEKGSVKGSRRPVAGTFSGMGFVRNPADLGQEVLLVAELQADLEEQSGMTLESMVRKIFNHVFDKEQNGMENDKPVEEEAAHEGSFEWIARRVAEQIASGQTMDEYVPTQVVATYSNYAIYKSGEDYYKVNFKRSGDKLNFEDPQPVDVQYTTQASAEGVEDSEEAENMSNNETPNAELIAAQSRIEALEAEVADEKAKNEKFEADRKAAEEAAEAEVRASTRLSELDAIAPLKDETLKAKLTKSLETMGDDEYAAFKETLAASVKPLGGITSDETIVNPDADKNSAELKADMETWRKEQAARFGKSSADLVEASK